MRTIILNPTAYAFANQTTWFTNLDTRNPQGMLDYVTPIINKMLTETSIPHYCTLQAITTFENPETYSGNHTWLFQLNNPDDIDNDETLEDTLTNAFKQIFPFDPEASMIAPNIFFDGNYFTVIVPYTC